MTLKSLTYNTTKTPQPLDKGLTHNWYNSVIIILFFRKFFVKARHEYSVQDTGYPRHPPTAQTYPNPLQNQYPPKSSQ